MYFHLLLSSMSESNICFVFFIGRWADNLTFHSECIVSCNLTSQLSNPCALYMKDKENLLSKAANFPFNLFTWHIFLLFKSDKLAYLKNEAIISKELSLQVAPALENYCNFSHNAITGTLFLILRQKIDKINEMNAQI